MVTRAYLDSLQSRAQFFPPYDHSEIEAELLNALIEALPDWDSRSDTILRRALPAIARVVAVARETDRAQLLRGLVAFAQGPDLDAIGLGPPPVRRNLQEEDEDYRLRIINAHARLNLGSLNGIKEQTFEFNSEITDALVTLAPNRQDVRVYALKGTDQLTDDEQASLAMSLNADGNAILGVTVTVAEPTIIEVRAAATVTYDPAAVSAETAEADAIAGMTAYINGALIGDTLYRNRLTDAAITASAINASAQFELFQSSTWTAQPGDLIPASGFAAAAKYVLEQPPTVTLVRA